MLAFHPCSNGTLILGSKGYEQIPPLRANYFYEQIPPPKLFSPSWSQPSDHLGHGNGATVSSWRTIHVSGLEVFEVIPKSPSPTAVKPRSCRSRRSGPSAVANGNAPGSAVRTVIDVVGSWSRRTVPSRASFAPAMITPPVTATGLARRSIGSGGVPACPTEPSRARGSLLRWSLLGCYVLQSLTSSGERSEASDD